jgi:hypothetical protein
MRDPVSCVWCRARLCSVSQVGKWPGNPSTRMDVDQVIPLKCLVPMGFFLGVARDFGGKFFV